MNNTTGRSKDNNVVVDDDFVVDIVQLESDIQKSAPRVIQHMNHDHSDSLKAYVLAFGEYENIHEQVNDNMGDLSQIQSATLTSLDKDGFLLQVTYEDGTKSLPNAVRVRYDRRIKSAKELHAIAISLHIKAFDKLGVWYKLSTGYYTKALQQIGYQFYKSFTKNNSNNNNNETNTNNRINVVVVTILTFSLAVYGYKKYASNRQRAIKL